MSNRRPDPSALGPLPPGAKVLGVRLPDAGPWAVEIDGFQPATLNSLLHCHWAVKAKRKARDRRVIACAVSLAGVPRGARKRRVGLVVTLGPRQRGPDVDAYWKSALDALVAAGALVDDSPAWCELRPVEYVRGPAKATRITLEDIHAG